jgi:GTP-binding protein EngB required for normal cell division
LLGDVESNTGGYGYMKLTSDQAEAVGQLLRDYIKDLCELKAAKSMIRNLSVLCQAPPEDWEKVLEVLTHEASTMLPVEAFHRVADLFQKNADEADLSDLLAKIPKDAPIN